VSIYLAETGDKAVERMIHEAVMETMARIETSMETRLRGKDEDGNERDGDENRTTGNMVYGSFVHRETRPIDGIPDPHYHIHCYTFNATYDQAEQRWKAGQFGNIKRDGPLYEAIFHERLAEKIEAAGLGIRRTDKHFELASVSRALVEKFSKRSRLIEQLAREKYTILEARARALMKESGMDFGDAFAQVKHDLGAESREKKSASKLSHEDKLADWRGQMTPEERESLTVWAVRSARSEGLIDVEAAKGLAVSELFERVSVKRESHVAAMLLRRGIGRVSVEEAEAWSKSGAFLPVSNKLVTTREVLADEEAMIQTAAAGRGRGDELGRGRQWIIRDEKVAVDEGQAAAVRHVLESKDLVTSIRGPAGTGKSTMAKEAVQAIEALSGRSVLLFAPSSSAVGVLKKEGFAKSDTFKQLEINETLQDAARGQVLWIDEAGFLSVKQMRWLVDFAERNRCRVILAGDTRQHHGVERGDALRIMERAGAVAQAALSKIFRQHNPALRAAMYALSAGRTEAGFDKLDKFGAIREMEDRQERLEAIAQTHLAAIQEGKSSLIVSPTHSEARAVAGVVRQAMRSEGLLTGEDQTVTRLQRTNLTESQRRDAINYEFGMVVEFHCKVKGGSRDGVREKPFKPGEHWQILRKEKSGTVIVSRNGDEKVLPLDRAGNFEVYRQEQLALAIGDQIRVTKNFTAGGQRYSNNELHKVAGLDGDRITLEDGRRIDGGMFHVDQGIVVTSHAAQGKTVDQVIASVPVSAFAQANEAQFYVSMSRARQAMHLFTDSKVALREAVCRPSARLSPYELSGANGEEQERTQPDLRAGAGRRINEQKEKEMKAAAERYAKEIDAHRRDVLRQDHEKGMGMGR